MLDQFKVQDCEAKLAKQDNIDTKLAMIYQWLKQDHINLPEFKVLVIPVCEG